MPLLADYDQDVEKTQLNRKYCIDQDANSGDEETDMDYYQ